MKFLRSLLAALAALMLASCYYDGYSYGLSSGGGYGSTSLVYTSSSRWVYDPYVRCYYDYNRRCYYDPYLCGYYPRNYCPRPIYGVPHPYGWSGRGKCPLPRNVNNRSFNHGYDRVAHLRTQNPRWGKSVQVRNDAMVNRWQANRLQTLSQGPSRPGSRGTGATQNAGFGRNNNLAQSPQTRSSTNRGSQTRNQPGRSNPSAAPSRQGRDASRPGSQPPSRSTPPSGRSQRSSRYQSVSSPPPNQPTQASRPARQQPAPRASAAPRSRSANHPKAAAIAASQRGNQRGKR